MWRRSGRRSWSWGTCRRWRGGCLGFPLIPTPEPEMMENRPGPAKRAGYAGPPLRPGNITAVTVTLREDNPIRERAIGIWITIRTILNRLFAAVRGRIWN